MKTRSKLVSNSSSSSFIIGVEDESDAYINVRVDLNKCATNVCETLDEWKAYLMENYSFGTSAEFPEGCSEYVQSLYHQGREQIESGRKIMCGIFCSEDFNDPTGQLLYALGLQDGRVIVYKDKMTVIQG